MTAKAKRVLKTCAYGAACALWLAYVFTNSLRSRAESARQSAFAEEFLRRLLRRLHFSGNVGRVAEITVRKSAHVIEFFVLYTFSALFFGTLFEKKRTAFTVAAALSLVAASADELLQLYSGRGASVRDVFIDSAGVALGVLACLIFSKLQKRRKNSRASERDTGP